MTQSVCDVLARVAETADYFGVDFSDINATNSLGDNALHCVAIWGDVESAKLLVEAGIEIDRFGDLGHTPLHNACSAGHLRLVEYLVANGADLFAQTEGNLPFTLARLAAHDQICNYLSPLMKGALAENQKAYVKSRIAQLRREIARLEAELRE